MRSIYLPLPLILCVGAMTGPLVGDVETLSQAQISLTRGASGTWNADWQGESHRVYFMQWSLDLISWNNCPFIDFGSGLHSRGINSTTAKLFIRLVYYDDPNLESIEQAEDSDYDGDHVSNRDEINSGLNPFDAVDSDSDNMADDWKRFWFNGSLGHDGTGNGDGDDFTDAEEFALGLNPTVNDSNTSARTISYDAIGRLKTSGTVSLIYDGEGNLKTSND